MTICQRAICITARGSSSPATTNRHSCRITRLTRSRTSAAWPGWWVSDRAQSARSFGEAPIDFFPIHVAQECIDVLGRSAAVIHVECVLVHIQSKQRQPCDRAMHVIPRPLVSQLVGVDVVCQNTPARAAGQ